jgi:hypothetical protein
MTVYACSRALAALAEALATALAAAASALIKVASPLEIPGPGQELTILEACVVTTGVPLAKLPSLERRKKMRFH